IFATNAMNHVLGWENLQLELMKMEINYHQKFKEQLNNINRKKEIRDKELLYKEVLQNSKLQLLDWYSNLFSYEKITKD
ncbi:993_t:CDS:2, partial [Dentiscutata heterogama]